MGGNSAYVLKYRILPIPHFGLLVLKSTLDGSREWRYVFSQCISHSSSRRTVN